MAKLSLLTVSFLVLLAGCEKPNPHPELLDPIYADLSKAAEEFKKQAETDKAAVADAKKELAAAVPQSRQIEYAQKRLISALEKARRSEQFARYFEVRAENRIEHDKIDYSAAWVAKKPWPDPNEYQQFLQSEQLASQHSIKWDANSRRVQEGFPVAKDKKSGEKPPEKKAEE